MLQCKPEFSSSAPQSVMQSRLGCSSRCSVARRQRCANSAYIKRLDCATVAQCLARLRAPLSALRVAGSLKACLGLSFIRFAPYEIYISAPAVTAPLFSKVVGSGACTRLRSLRQMGKTITLDRLIEAGAWADAAITLVGCERMLHERCHAAGDRFSSTGSAAPCLRVCCNNLAKVRIGLTTKALMPALWGGAIGQDPALPPTYEQWEPVKEDVSRLAC
jgi:hypothetical protein